MRHRVRFNFFRRHKKRLPSKTRRTFSQRRVESLIDDWQLERKNNFWR